MVIEKDSVIDRNWHYISMVLIFTSFLVCYFSTFQGLVHIWSTEGDYSYGFLIPVISLYLIWEKKHLITVLPVRTNWWGLAAFLVFVVISMYGVLGSSPSAVRPALPLIVLSTVLFCYGKRILRELLFPLSFLMFMIPLPTIVQTEVTVPLKLISTKLGVFFLRVFGVSVFSEGNVIDLGTYQLQVVDACSGLRYVIPLLALGMLVAYYFEDKKWKQALVVFITIPISIFTNGLRIGLTGVLTKYFGPEVAEGFFHDFEGWAIFMVAFVLFGLICLLLRIRFTDKLRSAYTKNKEDLEKGRKESNKTAVSIVVIVFLSLGFVTYKTTSLPGFALASSISNFNVGIPGWRIETQPFEEEIIAASGAEDAFNANLYSKTGDHISLYIGYRGKPFGENLNFFHSPTVCLPSSGWDTIEEVNHTIQGVPRFDQLPVKKMVVEKMGRRQLLYFWFQTSDRVSSNVNINRFHLSLHAIAQKDTSDLFIRPITTIRENESIAEAQQRLDDFIREMMPELIQFLKENEYRL